MSNGNGGLVIPSRSANSQVPKDRAEITVGGQKADDWETVWVQLRAKEGWDFFRFTTVEREASAGLFGSATQFNVEQPCKISIGGVQVIDGLIETRQVAYDAGRHHVELQGRSISSTAMRSSVHVKDGKFDGLSLKEAIEKAIKGYPLKVKVLGTIPDAPFDKLQAFPGEQIWDFAERICRPAGVVVGTDHENNLILAKQYTGRGGANLIEGVNIKHMQCVFDVTQVYQNYMFLNSHNESDRKWGQSITQMRANYRGPYRYKTILTTPSEQTVGEQSKLDDRAKFETDMREYARISATVVVQGWFRDESTLWWPWDQVQVQSPMCPLDETLCIAAVTFTQKSTGGTQATLDLANPLAMGGEQQKGALAGAPQKSDPPQPFG